MSKAVVNKPDVQNDKFNQLKAQKRLQQAIHNVKAKLIEAEIFPIVQ